MMTSDTNTWPGFNSLIDRYGSIINKVCYFYAHDIDGFQDLRQEALLNIWQGLESFDNKSNISTWIYRVTLNSCVTSFRKNKRNAKSGMGIGGAIGVAFGLKAYFKFMDNYKSLIKG